MSTDNGNLMHVSSNRKEQVIDITAEVIDHVRSSKIRSGICIVFVPHTTAGVTINENADADVKDDILLGLRNIVLDRLPYAHSEGNSTAHIKASLAGSSVTVIVENGEIVLGRWQGIYFCEFDGPRERHVMVKTISV